MKKNWQQNKNKNALPCLFYGYSLSPCIHISVPVDVVGPVVVVDVPEVVVVLIPKVIIKDIIGVLDVQI